MGKRELIALICLSSWCLVIVVWLFLTIPRVCLQFVIVVYPDRTHYFLGVILRVNAGSLLRGRGRSIPPVTEFVTKYDALHSLHSISCSVSFAGYFPDLKLTCMLHLIVPNAVGAKVLWKVKRSMHANQELTLSLLHVAATFVVCW